MQYRFLGCGTAALLAHPAVVETAFFFIPMIASTLILIVFLVEAVEGLK